MNKLIKTLILIKLLILSSFCYSQEPTEMTLPTDILRKAAVELVIKDGLVEENSKLEEKIFELDLKNTKKDTLLFNKDKELSNFKMIVDQKNDQLKVKDDVIDIYKKNNNLYKGITAFSLLITLICLL